MAPLEPWEKVLVKEDYINSVHAGASCISCHGGVQAPEKEAAHVNLILDPSADPQTTCGSCHENEVASYPNSLHANQMGYFVAMYSRSVPENHAALDTMFGNHCSSCHATCGDCHISQPNSVKGGFLNGHVFEKEPPMTRTCTACHGSRVGNEFLGKNEELPGDVHFRQERMKCTSCHTGMSMHDSEGANQRYAGEQGPSCESCHEEIGSATDSIPQHALHGDKLSCQVCHSITYTSCDNCHVSISEETGKAKFKTDATYMTFLIGKNPLINEDRPYEYVPVRHIPVDPTSYSYYGEDLLPNFDLLPTWAYATPHNIQRVTPQNESCSNCHGNAEIFLTEDKVRPEELNANKSVIVDSVPAEVGK